MRGSKQANEACSLKLGNKGKQYFLKLLSESHDLFQSQVTTNHMSDCEKI